MQTLANTDNLAAKQDVGTDVLHSLNGMDVTNSSGLPAAWTAQGALSTTATSLNGATPAAAHSLIIDSIKITNTGTSTRTVTFYRKTAGTTYDATSQWGTPIVLAGSESAEWTSAGWVLYDANGVTKFASASWPTIPEGATPPTPPTGYIRPFARSTHRMGVVDSQGIVSDMYESARHVNYLINGEFDYAQRQVAATATTYSNTTGRTYGADRWGVTNENASVQYARIDTLTPESGYGPRYYGQFTKITGAGKVVVSQAVEAGNCFQLRGRQVRVQLKMKTSVAATFRVALLQLTSAGTVDTIPATFISAFGANATDPTLGTNLAKVAPDAGSADNATIVNNGLSCSVTTSWQRFGATFTLPTDFKNLVIVVFSDSQVALNATFSMGEVGLYDGPEIREWTPRMQNDQLANCHRYYAKSFDLNVLPAQNVGLVGAQRGNVALGGAVSSPHMTIPLPTRMRANPTVTLFNPSAANAFLRQIVTPSDATATSSTSATDSKIDVTATGLAAWAVGMGVVIHYTADAEL